jgi:hypothetical protein
VFTFPNSQRAQQFAGWLFLAGYIDRVLEQNTVMVEVAASKRTVIIKAAARRGGRLMYPHGQKPPRGLPSPVAGLLCAMLGPRTGAILLGPL